MLHGEEDDNYYIAFYDPILDSYIEQMAEKKYGEKILIFDDETPMLRLSKENFEKILKSWKVILTKKPTYLIITQDKSGWINLEGKEELDIEELALVKTYKRELE